MHRVLMGLFWIFLVLYAVALLIFLTGTFGLFGSAKEPLSGIFLVPLGFPWIMLSGIAGDAAEPWLAAASPLVNLAILRWLARWAASRREGHRHA